MKTIEEKAHEAFKEATDPETGGECFFHYTDEMIYSQGFKEGYNAAIEITKYSEKELIDLRLKLKEANEKCSSLESYSRGLELKVEELENQINTINSMIGETIGSNGITSVEYPIKKELITCIHCCNKFEKYEDYPLQRMCNKCLNELTK
jgi:hypothetical protein